MSEMTADEYFYDHILAIGPACRPAANLKYNHLRTFSSPLDWMMDYSLDTVLHLFGNGFDDFFLQYEVDEGNPNVSSGKLRVVDTLNHIISIHHFPMNMWMSVSYPAFVQKMKYRAERMEAVLRQSSSIALVANRYESDSEMLTFLKSFAELYPHLRIGLINFRNDVTQSYDSYDEKLVFNDNHLLFKEYLINDTQQWPHAWDGNTFVWSQILKKYSTGDSINTKNKWIKLRKQNHELVAFGAGKHSVHILDWLSGIGIEVDGIAVSSMTDNPQDINGVRVQLYSEYSKDASIVICLESKLKAKEIGNILRSQGYINIFYVDDNLNLIMSDERLVYA